MDSPHFQSTSYPQRVRTDSNLSVQSIDNRGAIRKRSTERPRDRSVSASHTDRLYQLALEQSSQTDASVNSSTTGLQWITPEHSPQPQSLFAEPSLEPFPTWTVPTPPRSDSGVPTVCVDVSDKPAVTGISVSTSFRFDQPTTTAEMRYVEELQPKLALLTIKQLTWLLITFTIRFRSL